MHRLLVASIALLVLFGGYGATLADKAGAPTTTVASFGYTPSNGGPGTVLHLQGSQTYSQVPISIYVSKVKLPMPQSPKRLIGTAQPDKNGAWTASATIPATWSNGQPITAGTIYIDVDAVGDAGGHPFDFTPVGIPATGSVVSTSLAVLAILALLMLAIGSWLSVQSARWL